MTKQLSGGKRERYTNSNRNNDRKVFNEKVDREGVESDLLHYKSEGILTVDDLETKEFNDIIHFGYLGRKEKIKDISNESNPYVILNFIT